MRIFCLGMMVLSLVNCTTTQYESAAEMNRRSGEILYEAMPKPIEYDGIKAKPPTVVEIWVHDRVMPKKVVNGYSMYLQVDDGISIGKK